MSSSPGNREVAHRVFATEFDDANLSYSESDEERAPNYVVTPGGARINRLFAVGVLTEVERINEDTLRGRVVDPTGAFVTYAGQYQPDEQAFLDNTTPPAFVALSGKARTFQPEDSDVVYTSVRPESLNDVDADTRDRWTVTAARNTLRRVAIFDAALRSGLAGDDLEASLREAGVEAHLAAGIPKAIEHYGTTRAYLEGLRRLAVDALEVVAGEREEVRPLDVAPADPGPAELGALPEVDVDLAAPATTAEPTEAVEEAVVGEEDSGGEEAVEAAVETEAETEAEPETETVEVEESAEPTAESEGVEEEPVSEPETTGPSESARTVAAEAGTESTSVETEPETEAVEEEPAESEAEGGLGDFAEPGGESVQEDVAEESEALGDFDPEETTEEGMYELDEEERREVEEEFGTDFSTGSEVSSPGEVDIDVPETEDDLEAVGAEVEETVEAEAGGGAPAVEPEAEPAEPETVEPETEAVEEVAEEAEESTDEAATESESVEADSQPEIDAEDVDLEDAVVDAMKDLDEGDGAGREEVTAMVVQRTGADPGDVEDAIQDALLGGKCYEPADGTLKAI